VVGDDGAFWKNCANSFYPYLVNFTLHELLLVFAIFWQVGLFSHLYGQFAS